MQETIKVKLTEDSLYDFVLFHTYSKFSGFITNILGLAVVFMGIILYVWGKINFTSLSVYIIVATLFLCFTPFRIRVNARRMLKNNEMLREPCEYCFEDKGIWKTYGTKRILYKWEDIQKIVATPKTIGVYYATDEALILPKYAFEDRFMNVMKIVTMHVSREKVKFG